MRLIDADEWIEKLNAIISDEEAPSEIKDHAMFLVSEISAEPTAYDVSRVVEQLESKRDYIVLENYCGDAIGARVVDSIKISDAIDIVKRGGVE